MSVYPRLIMIAFSTSILAQPAAAGWLNGNQLHRECEAETPFMAMGYIFGVIDGVELRQQDVRGEPFFCLPDSVVGKQLFDVVCEYAASHAKVRHVPASYLTVAALMEAWPCGG